MTFDVSRLTLILYEFRFACEGEEKVVYASKHGTREQEKGCPSLPWSKFADFS